MIELTLTECKSYCVMSAVTDTSPSMEAASIAEAIATGSVLEEALQQQSTTQDVGPERPNVIRFVDLSRSGPPLGRVTDTSFAEVSGAIVWRQDVL